MLRILMSGLLLAAVIGCEPANRVPMDSSSSEDVLAKKGLRLPTLEEEEAQRSGNWSQRGSGNPHHFAPSEGPVTDFKALDERFDLRIAEVRRAENERRARVETERQRKISLYNTWLEFLETRRDDVTELFATAMEAKEVRVELKADENELTIIATEPGKEYHTFNVKVREGGAEADWKLSSDEQEKNIKDFFQAVLIQKAPDPFHKAR